MCTAGECSQEFWRRTRPEGEGGNAIRVYSSELSRLEAEGGDDDGYQYRVCSSELARLEAKGGDDDGDQREGVEHRACRSSRRHR